MKIIRYLLKHKGKTIGFFTMRSACVDMWNKIISKDISKIDDYQVCERVCNEEDDFNLLECE